MGTRYGALFSGIKRAFSGETIFQNAYFVLEKSGRIALAPGFPSKIVKIDIEKDQDWILSRNSFLAATGNVNVTSSWQGLRSIFGRGKSILTRVEAYGKGDLWISIFGSVRKHDLKENQQLIVDGVNVATFESGIKYDIDTKGFKFFLFGGSGFVFKFTGPGIVYSQSRSIEEFNRILQNNLIPKITRTLSQG